MIDYPEYFTQTLYLQELCNKYGDFKVAHAFKNKQGDMIWSKHRSVMECWQNSSWNFLKNVNNRNILSNEIVLDIDEGTNKESDSERSKLSAIKAKKLCNRLDKLGLDYSLYFTGSKGFHIHLLFNQELDSQRRVRIVNSMKVDANKISNRVMIALEFAPHWKTGNKKILIKKEDLAKWETQ